MSYKRIRYSEKDVNKISVGTYPFKVGDVKGRFNAIKMDG